ncbi:hypothetical protein [Enterobacter quasiroggenkampii]
MTERKFSRLYDIAIPDDMREGEIASVQHCSIRPGQLRLRGSL